VLTLLVTTDDVQRAAFEFATLLFVFGLAPVLFPPVQNTQQKRVENRLMVNLFGIFFIVIQSTWNS
jgi:hypothetical protein